MRNIRYQQEALRDLTQYLRDLNETGDLNRAWERFWERQDIPVGYGGVPPYKNAPEGVPYVCMKVPTGGGKTYMACCAVARVFAEMDASRPRVVVWLVPSDAILSQTLRALRDPNHEYRRRLDLDFAGRVEVYTKEELLHGQNFSPDTVREQLSVCVMSYASLRINARSADARKVNQENGNLKRFADAIQDRSLLLEDTPDTALIQVLRQLTPLVIVDESHNAGSKLSMDMLERLNPHFILALTATPLKSANILCYVDARALKKEHMVKLPVIAYNRADRDAVLRDAIQLRNSLEEAARREGEHGGRRVRPIVLLQAQPNLQGREMDTFRKIRQLLIESGIPEGQIAIKTGQLDEIGDTDLLDENCPIRYIITVNALKEGWDCPWAYILASFANKTSRVDVEQILGRVLRQPGQAPFESPLLNSAYVLTCSNDFRQVLENIVAGLNRAGFSRRDYAVGGEEPPKQEPSTPEPQQLNVVSDAADADDDFGDVHPQDIQTFIQAGDGRTQTSLQDMLDSARTQAAQYEEQAAQDDRGHETGEKGAMKHQIEIDPRFAEEIAALKLPQFCYDAGPNLFGDSTVLLEREHLSEGFSLAGQDAQVNFSLSTGEMYTVDLRGQGEAVPQYLRADQRRQAAMKEILSRTASDKRREVCVLNICRAINRNDRYDTRDVRDYVRRVVAGMSEDELAALEAAQHTYAARIREKIERLEDAWREKQFDQWIDAGRLFCAERYAFPRVITPIESTDSVPNSLYTAEKDDMNGFERRVLDAIAALPNLRWWHRVSDGSPKAFRLNGFINHYPDFIVRFQSGVVALIESKGDHLANDESRRKLALGRQWQALAGRAYRYFMVFNDNKLPERGSYTLDELVDVLKTL